MKGLTSPTLVTLNLFQHPWPSPNISGKHLRQYLGLFLATAILPWANPARSQQSEAGASAPIWSEITVRGSVPAHIRPAGEHGTVVVEGDVTPEGKISNLAVTKSSGSLAIDDHARNSVNGQSMPSDEMKKSPSRVRLNVEIYNPPYKDLQSMGSNLSCEQAVLDADWYARTFLNSGLEKTPQYLFIKFSYSISDIPELAFVADRKNYDRTWAAALDACRKTPTSSFFATLIATSKQ